MCRWLVTVLFALACAGCAAHRAVAWVPQLVVRGQLVQDESSMDWSVEGGLRWDLPRPPARREPIAIARIEPRSASGCAHHVTCAWERRERARALSSALELARRIGR